MTVWLNGHLAADNEARIEPTDRGFLLSDGIFETLLARDGHPVFTDKHLARLARGAATLGFKMPFTAAELKAAMLALLTANALDHAPRAALRVTLTRGPGPRGLLPPDPATPTLLIACFASPEPTQSVSAITSSIRRNEFSPLANLKALPYLEQILAKQEAKKASADEALFLNTNRKLVCATAANLFLWDSNTLITPPLTDGCLDGITRSAVINIAREKGIDCFEESITPSTLENVESGFLTNTLVGIQTLTMVDGRPLKENRRNDELRAALREAERASLKA